MCLEKYNNDIYKMEQIVNKGTCAGGSNTNLYGKKFEEITNNEPLLIEQGFIKKQFDKSKSNYYLTKTFENKEIVFVRQNGLKYYMKQIYNIDLCRCPDEAYIIKHNNGKCIIKILEKKEQRVEGSCETKLWSGPSLKREYELFLGNTFDVQYAFCVNSFLQKKMISTNKKYKILNIILNENNIDVLFGEDIKYFDSLDIWINNS